MQVYVVGDYSFYFPYLLTAADTNIGIFNIITDLVLIIYPMPMVLRTRLPLKK